MTRVLFRSVGARVGFALFGLAATGAAWGKGAERPVTFSLVDLGQQASGGRPRIPGSIQATVHFVGEDHLLVTFPVRRLMKRLPDCEPDDEDRTIDAVLVNLPTGKVAARTSWRLHDSGQYLWDLGRGRFLVRVRNQFLTVAPLENLSTDRPFQAKDFLAFEDRIVGVVVSAEGDLVTVETRERTSASGREEGKQQPQGPVTIHFFRVENTAHAMEATVAGRVLSRGAIEIPMTRDGYLDTNEESRGRWVFDYIAHGGRRTELSPYDTSCSPQAKFVSRSEFVAFGCRGSADKLEIGGFDMRGEEMWQQVIQEPFALPTFSFAPEAGRFALGRALTTGTVLGTDVAGEQMNGQDVIVIQAHTGKQIFHTVLTPVQRSGQNFAMSADGLAVAVIRGPTVEVHRLPGLSARDVHDVKEARETALERAAGEILLPTRSHSVAANQGVALRKHSSATDVAPVMPKPLEHPAPVENSNGDDEPRKAPTLYKPGESGDRD